MRCKESNAVRHHLLPSDLSKTSYSVTILKIRSLSDDGFEEGDIDFEGWDEGIKDGFEEGDIDFEGWDEGNEPTDKIKFKIGTLTLSLHQLWLY